ncbi:IS630 family transposase [Ferrovum myxofaciens]|uniref:IS630 family transposase n=2 Tax=root TaxID=1 RepID=A0A8F3IJM7_9PROT|nr:IS630 family transposase [Ferrovum myxofaciens]KXW57052.1 integrase core domain protein [Ferrovum myxofaciens]MBU6994104.1 IS630 family transposase [Ferrovum myxofaciens]QKE38983.1 MAG: IS630 family transposase [Ferrovum myxofaciens]QKE39968.1 MAG: IS630 family transposase [Ferrovum myxofaciens]QWY74204.1 MAG: IS630 family transposase [Ferrovum myxofaciens]
MGRKTDRAPLVLTPKEKESLTRLSQSRTASKREIERACILLKYAEGMSFSEIHREIRLSRPSIYKCIDKALAAGVSVGLKDKYHRPKSPEITEEAKSWVVSLACCKPKDHGFAAELWTLSALTAFVHERAESAGFPRLARVPKMTIWRILDTANIKPHRIRYYLEKKDPDFDRKMREVLMVYQEVNLQNDRKKLQDKPVPEEIRPVITVSVDEKPGVQAIQNTAPDLPPVPGRHAEVGRDYEYIRHGTLSILAALDLHTGEVIANVEERHRSQEFVALLKRLDERYPKEATIRVVLDNHSAHISKETFAYLAAHPNRFEYVHTPKHGSWLNLVETAFSKMARTFLRHIRVSSKEELKGRIEKGIAEWNEHPVVFRWSNFDLGLE